MQNNNKTKWGSLMGLIGLFLLPLWSIAQVNLDSGLVAYYPFNGNANDSSGNGFNGAVFGATITADRSGNPASAYSFDGVDDYIEIQDEPELRGGDNPFSFCLWFQTDTGFVFNVLMNKYLDDRDKDWGFRIQEARLTFASELGGGDVLCQQDTGTSLIDSSWHCAIILLETPNVNIYLDGQLVKSCSTYANESATTTAPVEIGRAVYNPNFPYYSGKIDDIRIYNRLLSEEEITSLCNLRTTDVFQSEIAVFSLFPNPAPGAFTLNSPEATLQSIELYDLTSRRLPAEIRLERHEAKVRCRYQGLVIAQVLTDRGVWTQKVWLE
ncbi:MAG: LamG domain-containing protein [Bacteroidota bacterium]